MPVSSLMDKVFKRRQLGKSTFDIKKVFTFHSGSFYYDLLIDHVHKLELWETAYIHTMNSYQDILEMIKSTGLKPYLEQLADDQEKLAFEAEVLAELKTIYPQQANGKILLPFKRLFFIAYK
jgi:trans-aconitate 2-methyltransferase